MHIKGALAPYDSIRGQAATQGQINAAEKITCGLTKKASADWTPLVPMKALDAGYQDTRYTYFTINSEQRWTHLRVNMFPDGGIARIRVHGDVVLPATAMVAGATAIDLCTCLEWQHQPAVDTAQFEGHTPSFSRSTLEYVS